MHYTWVNWIATIRTDVSIFFFDQTFSPAVSSSNNDVIKTISLTLPSNPIVQFYLTGWEFVSSFWRMALYSKVNSFDTTANTVSLKFSAHQSNTWSKASGFVIVFSKNIFNKRGNLSRFYNPQNFATSQDGTIVAIPHIEDRTHFFTDTNMPFYGIRSLNIRTGE